ncbi:MAG: molybdate ABC transporter substrate-binding protein [Pseudomonadales bacterium]|nr:molybdate ABC transporter substrate-binding protein [Pseudomonadales bacterium]
MSQKLLAYEHEPSAHEQTTGRTILVAVASNFTAPMKTIVTDFEKKTGHKVTLAFSSSGKLYAQIRNHAPFHLFLSGDVAKPRALEKEALIVPTSRFTYAIGTLVLWSRNPTLVNEDLAILKSLSFNRLAIANPKIAPYGAAAEQVLKSLNLYDAVYPKLIRGDNISQTFQLVWIGSADLGLVSLSQLVVGGTLRAGSAWIVPGNRHSPIRQDAVLLLPGRKNNAAIDLLNYLQSEAAKKVIVDYGYRLP